MRFGVDASGAFLSRHYRARLRLPPLAPANTSFSFPNRSGTPISYTPPRPRPVRTQKGITHSKSRRLEHTVLDVTVPSGPSQTSSTLHASTLSHRAFTGLSPDTVTATFTTEPPASYEIGGVSVQPPARSILAAALLVTLAPTGSACCRCWDWCFCSCCCSSRRCRSSWYRRCVRLALSATTFWWFTRTWLCRAMACSRGFILEMRSDSCFACHSSRSRCCFCSFFSSSTPAISPSAAGLPAPGPSPRVSWKLSPALQRPHAGGGGSTNREAVSTAADTTTAAARS